MVVYYKLYNELGHAAHLIERFGARVGVWIKVPNALDQLNDIICLLFSYGVFE
jgi:hypothetical protein